MESLIKEIRNCKVEWRKLGEVTNYEQPTKYIVKSANYSNDYDIPVLTAGKTFILGYTNEKEGVYKAFKSPVIIFDDFTTANKWVDFDFKVKSSAMKLITSKDENEVLLKYIYYWLNTLPNEISANDHKRQWINNYCKKTIPIPPLDIQKKIVKILDKFTELTTELTTKLSTELTLRKKQYSYYLNKLLSFDKQMKNVKCKMKNEGGAVLTAYNEVEWKELGEVVEIKNGKDWKKLNKGNIPVYGSGGIIGYVDKASYNDESVLIPRKGTITNIFYVDKPFWNVDTIFYTIINKSILYPKYFYYFMLNYDLEKLSTESTRPSLTQSILKKIKIPIPPLEKQKEIVSILDKFNILTNSLTEGLPREIELRKKQYEYYRNLMLDFRKDK